MTFPCVMKVPPFNNSHQFSWSPIQLVLQFNLSPNSEQFDEAYHCPLGAIFIEEWKFRLGKNDTICLHFRAVFGYFRVSVSHSSQTTDIYRCFVSSLKHRTRPVAIIKSNQFVKLNLSQTFIQASFRTQKKNRLFFTLKQA